MADFIRFEARTQRFAVRTTMSRIVQGQRGMWGENAGAKNRVPQRSYLLEGEKPAGEAKAWIETSKLSEKKGTVRDASGK